MYLETATARGHAGSDVVQLLQRQAANRLLAKPNLSPEERQQARDLLACPTSWAALDLQTRDRLTAKAGR